MKTFKKALAVVLCVVMTLTAAPLGGFVGMELPDGSGFKKIVESISMLSDSFSLESKALTEDDFTYYITDGEITIKSVNTSLVGQCIIPSVIEGCPVTCIDNYAFYGCSKITNITIPDSITSIGNYAFYYCTSLTELSLPVSLEIRSAPNMFENCTNIERITLTAGTGTMTSYSDYNYTCAPWNIAGCSEIIIEDGVTNISSYAFYKCANLKSIIIPSSVKKIGSYAFYGCNELTDVYYMGEASSWYEIDYADQKSYLTTERNIHIDGKVIDYSEIIEIPEGATKIGNYAFYNKYISKITIPDSVEIIGSYAFSNCASLKSVIIGNGVISIQSNAFAGCENLASIIIPNNVTTIGYSAFYGCSKLADITFGNSIKNIYSYAFYHCTALTNITMPDTLTTIGSSAFSGCSNLTAVTFNENSQLTTIENDAFSGCDNLTSITIPDSATTIGCSAFYGCDNLTSVTIGKNVTTIGESAFQLCNRITVTYYKGTETEWNSIDIGDVNNNLIKYIVFESDSENAYYAYGSCGDNLFWKFYADGSLVISGVGDMEDYEEIYSGITSVGSEAPWFKWSSRITSIDLSENLTSIGDCAFYGCTNLTNVTIPDSVSIIGNRAFYNCVKIRELTIPASANTVSSFGGCTNIEKVTLTKGNGIMRDYHSLNPDGLKEIVIEEGITNIGAYAFNDCTGITSLTIPDSVTSIGDYAFNNCTNLTNITIPDSVTSIGVEAFVNTGYYNDSSNWEDYVLYNGNQLLAAKTRIAGDYSIRNGTLSIAGSAFKECTALTGIIIPDSVTSIGDNAFFECNNLANATIGNSVTAIGEKAFYNCYKLTDLSIPDSVITIGTQAFSNCSGLKKLTIGNGVKVIESDAFYWCYIQEFYYTGNISDWCSISFGEDSANPMRSADKIYIDGELLSGELIIPNGISIIGNNVFAGCSGLTSIIIPDSVTSIGNYAFENCDALTSIIIPNNVTSIGDGALKGCSNIKSATIPQGVTSIGERVFEQCISLVSVIISSNVKSIDNYAFYNCKALVDVYYFGSESDWDAVSIGSNNEKLLLAKIHYNHVHNCVETVVAPSKCTIEGKAYEKCACGYKTAYYSIPATGHNYESIVTPPTCLADGYTTYTCSVCGDTYTDNIVPSTGHSYKATVVAPTCTKDGYTNNVCSACGDFYHSDTVEKLGHTKGEWEYIGGKEYAKSCTVCGDKLESKIVTVDMFFNSENVNKKQVLNKSTATVTATVTDNFVNDLVFASSDSSTVSVDENGNVVANDVGKATITVTIKGTAISDSIEVEVLPRDFTITWNVNGKQTKQTVKEYAAFTPNVNTTRQGYKFIGWDKTVPSKMLSENLEFTARYELIVKQLKIKNPSVTTINYGETLVLHADYGNVELPEGWTIQWTVEGTGFSTKVEENGLKCKVTSVANGNATVKATLVDENGEAVLDTNGNEMSDSKNLTSKAGFFQKLASFFKNLFGISRVILQSI